jgi:hypothetical protein
MDLGIKEIVFIFTKTLLPPSIFWLLSAPQKGFQPIYVPLDSRSTYILHFLGSSYTKVRSYDGAAAAAAAVTPVAGKFVFRERKRFQRPTALSLFKVKMVHKKTSSLFHEEIS